MFVLQESYRPTTVSALFFGVTHIYIAYIGEYPLSVVRRELMRELLGIASLRIQPTRFFWLKEEIYSRLD